MSSASVSGSKRSLTIILAIVAVVFLILAILWLSGSSPSFMNSGSHVKSGGHILRGIVGLVVAIVAGAGAWWTNKKS